ncbi:hypothetical protein N2152v2_002767 [Parachlorella kessleri]
MLAWMGGKKKLMALARHKQSQQKQQQTMLKRPLAHLSSAPATDGGARKADKQPSRRSSHNDGTSSSEQGISGNERSSRGRARRSLAAAFGDSAPTARPAGAAEALVLPKPRPHATGPSPAVPATAGAKRSISEQLGESPPAVKLTVPPPLKRSKVLGKPISR